MRLPHAFFLPFLLCLPGERSGRKAVTALPSVPKHDYSQALHLSYLFYESQKSGDIPKNERRLAWRDSSCSDCIGPNGEDLSGGYYEAGNTMKFGLPLAFTLTQNAWAAIEFRKGLETVNEYGEAQDMVQWGTDYLIKAYSSYSPEDARKTDAAFIANFRFVGHLGNIDVDFEYMGPPEEFTQWADRQSVSKSERRPAYYVQSSARSSEIVGESAAAMASASILLRDKDRAYSQQLVNMAKQLFRFGMVAPGSYGDIKNVKGFVEADLTYPANGDKPYLDELAWAAVWLYKATGEKQYMDHAIRYYNMGVVYGGWGFSWGEKDPALHIMMLQIGAPDQETYMRNAKQYFNAWLPGKERTVPHTPGGLGYRIKWGSIQYAANTAQLGMIFAKYLENNVPAERSYAASLRDYSASQVDYILGSNPYRFSYMVGYSRNYPKSPYHLASYNSILKYPLRECPCKTKCIRTSGVRCVCDRPNGSKCDSVKENLEDFLLSSKKNQHILYGGIVGGPIEKNGYPTDSYIDSRQNYEYSEVAIDYNAGMNGALAGLIEWYGGSMKPSSDCNLDLGWSYSNAGQSPQWPSNDCYHKCCNRRLEQSPRSANETFAAVDVAEAATLTMTIPAKPETNATIASPATTTGNSPPPATVTSTPSLRAKAMSIQKADATTATKCPNGSLDRNADCRSSPDCCASGYYCYEKDRWWASCRGTCVAADEAGWTCTNLSSTIAAIGSSSPAVIVSE